MDETLMKKIQEQIGITSEAIMTESKQREESEQTMYDMLKDVVGRVKLEVELERKDR